MSDGAAPAGWQAGDAHARARTCSLPAQTHGSARQWERARVQTHLRTCSCVGLPHLENFPFFIRPDVLTLCTLGCVGTRAHSLLGHVHPHSLWHTPTWLSTLAHQPQVQCRWPHCRECVTARTQLSSVTCACAHGHACVHVHTGVTRNASPVPSPPVPVPALAQTDRRKVPSVPWQEMVLWAQCSPSALSPPG